MPSACDTVRDAGNGLLMATHQLKQQPFSNKVRYNLVDSARNILEGTMKVLTSLYLLPTCLNTNAGLLVQLSAIFRSMSQSESFMRENKHSSSIIRIYFLFQISKKSNYASLETWFPAIPGEIFIYILSIFADLHLNSSGI